MTRLAGMVLGVFLFQFQSKGATEIQVNRTPDGGIQPQAVIDGSGTLHLIYFKGDPAGGDVFYVRRPAGEKILSNPVRVNTRPGSAIAIGNVRGPQLALGKKSRAHVAWMGGSGAVKPTIDGREVTPMLYTRLAESGVTFEPERNLITWAAGLDGGGTVAADPHGRVYVIWHGAARAEPAGESERAVYVARSLDDGGTFERERQANRAPVGACGCCGIRASAGADGQCLVLFRAANQSTRDMTLLFSTNHGDSFEITSISEWPTTTCPMSTSSLAFGRNVVFAATEAKRMVGLVSLEQPGFRLQRSARAPGTQPQRHPVAATNTRGEVLLAWTEGMDWGKGGAVRWQLFDPDLNPVGEPGIREGVPVWSLVSVCARPDGSFELFH